MKILKQILSMNGPLNTKPMYAYNIYVSVCVCASECVCACECIPREQKVGGQKLKSINLENLIVNNNIKDYSFVGRGAPIAPPGRFHHFEVSLLLFE